MKVVAVAIPSTSCIGRSVAKKHSCNAKIYVCIISIFPTSSLLISCYFSLFKPRTSSFLIFLHFFITSLLLFVSLSLFYLHICIIHLCWYMCIYLYTNFFMICQNCPYIVSNDQLNIVCMFVCVCVYVWMWICVNLCVCVFEPKFWVSAWAKESAYKRARPWLGAKH